jgi:hypothetical protein
VVNRPVGRLVDSKKKKQDSEVESVTVRYNGKISGGHSAHTT